MVHTDVRYSIVQHKHTNNLATSISSGLKFIYYITLNFYESKWKLAVPMCFLETELHRISTLIIIVDVCLLICIYIYAIIFAYILHTSYHNGPYHRRPWGWIYYFGIINYGSIKNWAAVCLLVFRICVANCEICEGFLVITWRNWRVINVSPDEIIFR